MITDTEAFDIAEKYVDQLNIGSKSSIEFKLLKNTQTAIPGGWKFYYNSATYVTIGDESDFLMGHFKFGVSEKDGQICTIGDGSDIGNYLSEGAKKAFF